MKTEGDCINLMNIKNTETKMTTEEFVNGISGDILTVNDIREVCPGLELKPYQLVGVNWMKLLHLNNVNGVLADDMGLGKTVQTISFLGWLKKKSKGNDPHLIVVPGTVIANWAKEINKFCPDLKYKLYHASQSERETLRVEIDEEIRNGSIDIIITSYSYFERENNKDEVNFLKKQPWNYLILDEAHSIKNPSTLK